MRDRLTVAALVVVAALPCSAQAARFGVADTFSDGPACATLAGPPLASGQRVQFVAFDPPRRVAGEVVRVRGGACERSGLLEGAAYDLRLDEVESVRYELGLVVAAPEAELQAVADRMQLTGAGEPIVLSRCAGSDGLHFLARRGRATVWHAYYYLGYDVDPTCTADDLP